MIIVAIGWVFCVALLAMLWSRDVGILRALAAGACRAGWTLPIILSLFPETVTRRIPGSVALQPVHILVDDSESMALPERDGKAARFHTRELLKRVDDVCIQFGCLPKVTNLSEIASDTKSGFTPLSRVIEPWLYKTGGEPWMLLSDGGDFRPSLGWDDRVKDRGARVSARGRDIPEDKQRAQKTLGLIAAFGAPRVPGFSVDSVLMAPLAFEGKTVQLSAVVNRVDADTGNMRRVQVQVLLDGKVVTSGEADFGSGSTSSTVDMVFAAPNRGPHIVIVKALPVAGEMDTWDNAQTRVLDVLPNTVGVLHLLGAPAWDGRFFRRFLKAEPKFDVISFFILRDPWDSQQVSEREMSLIPFPVERLFKEELVNFRVIVMQNFTLMRFLQPEYQESLAKFVKDGGGLLFIGGPRALTEADATSSALAGLLPFSMVPGGASAPVPVPGAASGEFDMAFGGGGSSWDPDASFKIEMAAPDASRRALANVYESWQGIGSRLSAVSSFKGIHRMESIKFRDQEVTPLLSARMKDGRVVPLAVASYPGKGRALWLFSDSLWRLAMSSDPRNARSDYHAFMDGAMSWLTRGDMRSALSLRDFKVSQVGDRAGALGWKAALYGSAARYVKSATATRLSVCGIGVPADGMTFGGASGDTVEIEGEIAATLRDGSLCSLKLDVEHPSFGSLTVSGWAVIPETLADKSMGPSPTKLRQLALHTGAEFVESGAERSRAVEAWLQKWGAADGRVLPDKMKSIREFYWMLDFSWVWVFLLLLPAEVLIRRWHLISGQGHDPGVRGGEEAE